MARIEVLDEKHTLFAEYKVPQIKNAETALEWIADVAVSGILKIKVIHMFDASERSSEGSLSDSILEITDKNAFVADCLIKRFDDVSVTGEYNGNPVVLGVNLNKKTVYITCRKKKMADYQALEREFDLV